MHDIVVAGAGRGRSRADSEPGQRGNEVGGCLESWLLATLLSTGLPDVFPTLLQSEEPQKLLSEGN